MNLFEDLVEELKEEDLLESTVIESRNMNGRQSVNGSAVNGSSPFAEELAEPASEEVDSALAEMAEQVQETADEEEENDFSDERAVNDELSDLIEIGYESEDEEIQASEMSPEFPEGEDLVAEQLAPADPQSDAADFDLAGEAAELSAGAGKLAKKQSARSGKEFFKKKANDEVKGLQMVDHIITRVEKEQIGGVVHMPFDDLKVKQCLHRFMQLGDDAPKNEVSEIEFTLLQETEAWYTALSHRDREITVENLRSYCDTTIPSLSTQALLALARFYRNAPYSEPVRSKFDLIITKLYTDTDEEGKRYLVFEKSDIVQDISDLYAEWSSVPLYSTSDGESDIELGALGFEDFVEEAKRAQSFDDLVSKDFFRRLNDYKQKSCESFYAPKIVAAAIECNVEVGNRYIELLEREHGDDLPDEFEDKYGVLTDSAIAEAIRKIVNPVESDAKQARKKAKKAKAKDPDMVLTLGEMKTPFKPSIEKKVEWYHANKTLVVVTALTVVLGLGYLFFFSSYFSGGADAGMSKGVVEVTLVDSQVTQYVGSARIAKGSMFAITNEKWITMDSDQKRALMQRMFSKKTETGFTQITFLDSQGKRVGYISDKGVELPD